MNRVLIVTTSHSVLGDIGYPTGLWISELTHPYQVLTEVGFEAIDAGPLSSARLLEPLALLWIRLAYVQGLGRDFGLALLRR